MSERTKTILKFVVSIVLIVVSAYLSIMDIKPADLMRSLATADYIWALASVPVALLAHFFRALRWKTILKPIHSSPNLYRMFKAVMIGYAANSVTPRGGELLRPYIYARSEKISFSSSFATIVFERFIDILTLLALFAITLLAQWNLILGALSKIFQEMNVEIQPQNFLTLIALAVLIAISSFYPPVIAFFLRIFVKPISKNFYEKLKGAFGRFREGFAILKSPSQYFRLMMESVLIWICYGLPMYLMFFCFDFQTRLNLGPWDAFLMLIVVGVSVTIAPTPGAIGVHHIAVKTAMMALYGSAGLTEKEALAYAIITHAMNYVVNTLTGGFYYVLKKKDIAGAPENLETARAQDARQAN